jgi:predicted RNA-binding Zn-ribbon protein involved in translation (DUF1610 family)
MMEGQNLFTKSFLGFLENFISLITTGEITNKIVQVIGLLFLIVWIYCGVKLALDARRRYKLNYALQILLLILGVVTGPIGLLFYVLTRPKYTKDEVDFLQTEHKFYFQQASKVVECISCGKYIAEGHEYCTHCGEQNRIRCVNCNNLTNLDDKFCFYCGFKFDEDRKDNLLKALGSKELPKIELERDSITSEAESDTIVAKKSLGFSSFKETFKGLSNNALLQLNLKGKLEVPEVEEKIAEPEKEFEVIEEEPEEAIEMKEQDEIIEEPKKQEKKDKGKSQSKKSSKKKSLKSKNK